MTSDCRSPVFPSPLPPLPLWQTQALPPAVEGIPYTAILIAIGCERFEALSELPPGLTLTSDGRLTGTPGYVLRDTEYDIVIRCHARSLDRGEWSFADRQFILYVRDVPVRSDVGRRTRTPFGQVREAPVSESPRDLGDRRRFLLSWLPAEGSLSVHVNNQLQLADQDYAVNGNLITFRVAKSPSAHIECNYRNVWSD